MIKIKLRTCTGCTKEKPVFANIKGKPYCEVCSKKEKAKIAKEKRKEKREKKREVITEKKLDTLVSKVIRTLYGDRCCTCSNLLEFSKLHCGHALSRRFRVTRFNPQNLSSQCPTCNLFFQGMQYEFGKYINRFHGEGTMEKLTELSMSDIKIGVIERKELYKIFEEALEHKDLERLIEEYYQIVK